MSGPSVEFLIRSLVVALLDNFQVDRPPVPVRKMIASPPPDLARDLSLTENSFITFCEAMWLRLIGGQGVVFVNANLPEPQRRYAMACALFAGLCSTEGGRAVGLYDGSYEVAKTYEHQFARELLIPLELLPSDWDTMSAAELSALFDVPVSAAGMRIHELRNQQHHWWHSSISSRH